MAGTPAPEPIPVAEPAPPPYRWMEEPAKVIGWLIAAVIAAAALITELIAELTDLFPEGWRERIRAAGATVTIVGLMATRIQAVLTRHRVYSPATFEAYAGPVNASPTGSKAG